jgi:hypothetical protein
MDMVRGSCIGRALAPLLLILIAGLSSAPASCSMRMADAPGPETHECCTDGLSAALPACCHAQLSMPTPGIVVGKSAAATPAVAAMLSLPAPTTTTAPLLAPATTHVYARPPAVLRI